MDNVLIYVPVDIMDSQCPFASMLALRLMGFFICIMLAYVCGATFYTEKII